MGAAVLAESDLDRITDRFKALMLEARSEGGLLPCHEHDGRIAHLRESRARLAVFIGIIVAVASLLGSAAAGALFDRVAEKALQDPPSVTSPVPASPHP